MCHRTNQTFTTCGHTTDSITKCGDPIMSKSRWRCVSLRKAPDRKSVEGKCLQCGLKEVNEQFQAGMAAIVRSGKVEGQKAAKSVKRADSAGDVEGVDAMEGVKKGLVDEASADDDDREEREGEIHLSIKPYPHRCLFPPLSSHNLPNFNPPLAIQSRSNPARHPRPNQVPTPPKMCHRTNHAFAICGHTTETTTKCRNPNSAIIPRRCLPHFKLPETKRVEGKCMPCAIKEANAVRAAKEEAERVKMEEVAKEAKIERTKMEEVVNDAMMVEGTLGSGVERDEGENEDTW